MGVKYAYHRTEPEYLKSICAYGLVPRFRAAWAEPPYDDPERKLLFFSDSPHSDAEHIYGELLIRFPWPNQAKRWLGDEWYVEDVSVPASKIEFLVDGFFSRCSAAKNPAHYLSYLGDVLISRASCSSVVPIYGVTCHLCPDADAEHAASWRQFMHVGHVPGVICYARATAELPLSNQVGLFVHEIGHLAAMASGNLEHSEEDANRIGAQLTGIEVEFRGPHRLERAKSIPAWLKRALR